MFQLQPIMHESKQKCRTPIIRLLEVHGEILTIPFTDMPIVIGKLSHENAIDITCARNSHHFQTYFSISILCHRRLFMTCKRIFYTQRGRCLKSNHS